MKFKVNKVTKSVELLKQAQILINLLIKEGHILTESFQDVDFVLNLIDLDSPVAYRRKIQEEKVVSIAFIPEEIPDMKSTCYVALVKSISNMLFCIVATDQNDHFQGYSITPEVGFVEFIYSPEIMTHYMYPVISSHFVIRNKLFTDLNLNNNHVIPEIDDIMIFAQELKMMGVLLAPFPLTEFLTKEMIDHLFRLYEIKALSYGNLSIRNNHFKTDGTTFWMTARGVDKSILKGIGKDILLVEGYDADSGEMHIAVPTVHDPDMRVSVDAIEHYMIYREFPDIGAIVHVHAWMDNILCTDQTYPCGTMELAQHVVELLRSTNNPARTVVGLKNHGITVTGPDIREIFERLRNNLKINVPMFK